MTVLKTGIRIWAGASFSLLHSVRTGFGANPACYITYTEGEDDFTGVKRPEHETNHSSPSSAESRSGGVILPHPHTPSWCSA
jgi:hypothetical protein